MLRLRLRSALSMHITLQIITAKSPAKEQDLQTVLACCMYDLIFGDPTG